MGTSRSHGLAFLLSLGAIPLACTDGEGESSAGSTGDTTGATGMTTGSTSTSTSATEATESSSASGTTTSAMTTEGSTTGADDELCSAYAQKVVECYPRTGYAATLCYCQNQRDFGAALDGACRAAIDGWLQCQALASSCDLVSECEAEDDAVSDLCEGQPTPGAACVAWGDHYAACYGARYADPAAAYCQSYALSLTHSYGIACGEAYEDLYACLAAAECGADDFEETCPEERSHYEKACTGDCEG
ncbi:MAG: hypothetical protein R3B09_20445 [Nannocystaceae bacterium]